MESTPTPLTSLTTPQLKHLHRGKVREAFRIDEGRRLIVATDRLSCFDSVMGATFLGKGAILNGIANAWFEKTRHIIDNHLICSVDPQASLVREATPIRVEVIVRGYMTGSIWRKYAKGERTFSGVTLPDGLKKNQPFDTPIITPTTKDECDSAITPEGIVATGLATKEQYAQMEKTALELFAFGSELCEQKGMILVDTKYEFGLIDGKLVLIDEIHTPDSSRFWDLEAYKQDPESEHWLDKEYIRQWMLANPQQGTRHLPEEVLAEARNRYLTVYERLLGVKLESSGDPKTRLAQNLTRQGFIKDGYVAVVMGSKKDLEYGLTLLKKLQPYGVATEIRVCSAHKNGEELTKLTERYNNSIEPGAAIAVAGMSNGLGGALSANCNIPVISSPPFSSQTDMLVNLNSSLMMPSAAPSGTCVGATNTAALALRSLNLPRLRSIFSTEIACMKEGLKQDDLEVSSHSTTCTTEVS